MSETIQNAFSVVEKPKTKKKSKSWTMRTIANEKNWDSERENLQIAVVATAIIGQDCMDCESEAVIRCVDCGNKRYCRLCDDVIHKQSSLHNRVCSYNGFLQPLSPQETINEDLKIIEIGMY